jgi:hypothetical protein
MLRQLPQPSQEVVFAFGERPFVLKDVDGSPRLAAVGGP